MYTQEILQIPERCILQLTSAQIIWVPLWAGFIQWPVGLPFASGAVSTCPHPLPLSPPHPPPPHRKVNSTWGWARWASLGGNQEFQLNQGTKKSKFRLRFIFCPIISVQLLKYICKKKKKKTERAPHPSRHITKKNHLRDTCLAPKYFLLRTNILKTLYS